MKTKEEIDLLVEENLKLVHFVINRKYKNIVKKLRTLNLYDDFYQEGCIGLYKAAKTFDYSRGVKFSSYGYICIQGNLNKFLKRYIFKHYKDYEVSTDENLGNDGEAEVTILNVIPIYDKYGTEFDDVKKFAETTNIENIEEIIDLSLKGFSQEDIGARLELSQVGVSRRIKRLGQEYMLYESLGQLVRINKVS